VVFTVFSIRFRFFKSQIFMELRRISIATELMILAARYSSSDLTYKYIL
jgi:hypothetical protein